MAAPSAPRCDGCGRVTGAGPSGVGPTGGGPTGDCPTGGACRGPYEPPRYCTDCGRRLRVVVTPVGWTATCRDHGAVMR